MESSIRKSPASVSVALSLKWRVPGSTLCMDRGSLPCLCQMKGGKVSRNTEVMQPVKLITDPDQSQNEEKPQGLLAYSATKWY